MVDVAKVKTASGGRNARNWILNMVRSQKNAIIPLKIRERIALPSKLARFNKLCHSNHSKSSLFCDSHRYYVAVSEAARTAVERAIKEAKLDRNGRMGNRAVGIAIRSAIRYFKSTLLHLSKTAGVAFEKSAILAIKVPSKL